MARYTGPRVRISRRFGVPIFGPTKYLERRNYGPERVARAILKAIAKNRVVAPVTPEAWVAYWIKRLFPWLIWLGSRASARSLRQS